VAKRRVQKGKRKKRRDRREERGEKEGKRAIPLKNPFGGFSEIGLLFMGESGSKSGQ